MPSEVNGKLVNLRMLGSAQIYTGDPLFHNPTLKNLEPRAGLAWDPFGDGKTGGARGIFRSCIHHSILPMDLLQAPHANRIASA